MESHGLFMDVNAHLILDPLVSEILSQGAGSVAHKGIDLGEFFVFVTNVLQVLHHTEKDVRGADIFWSRGLAHCCGSPVFLDSFGAVKPASCSFETGKFFLPSPQSHLVIRAFCATRSHEWLCFPRSAFSAADQSLPSRVVPTESSLPEANRSK